MSGAANYSRLVFDYDPANPTLYEKIFCVNPPPDICPFGPCPNSDVTGIGQQVSIYITTVIYAIVLVYIPWLGRPMLYAHLSVIYSLLIAALISILKTSLTQNDGVFVLVSVASPATLYLWYLSIRSIWSPKWFPVDLPEKHKSTEFQILRVLTILSLAFTIALVCLMYVPSEKINFSQPACSQVFGRELWYNIAWQLPWVIQVASITVLFFFTLGVSWIWSLRRRYEVPPKSHLLSYMEPADFKADPYAINPPMRQNIDIVTWTESILHDVYPRFMNPTLSSSIVAIMQWNIVPAWIWVIPSKDTIAFFILAYGLFREPPKPHEPHPWMIWYIRMIVLVAAVAAVLICHKIQILSLVDWVFIFVVITSIIWSVKNFTYRNMKVFLPTILSLSIPIVFGAQVLTFVLGSSKAFSREAQENPLDIASTTMPFMISTVSMAWWLISWNATAFWPWKVYLRPKEFSKALTPRTHLLKFFFLVLGPHILWVQACIGSNPTGSTDMTFGQIFALIVSLVSILTIFDEAKDVPKKAWLAAFSSRRMPPIKHPSQRDDTNLDNDSSISLQDGHSFGGYEGNRNNVSMGLRGAGISKGATGINRGSLAGSLAVDPWSNEVEKGLESASLMKHRFTESSSYLGSYYGGGDNSTVISDRQSDTGSFGSTTKLEPLRGVGPSDGDYRVGYKGQPGVLIGKSGQS